jgi:hypothetical protein
MSRKSRSDSLPHNRGEVGIRATPKVHECSICRIGMAQRRIERETRKGERSIRATWLFERDLEVRRKDVGYGDFGATQNERELPAQAWSHNRALVHPGRGPKVHYGAAVSQRPSGASGCNHRFDREGYLKKVIRSHDDFYA